MAGTEQRKAEIKAAAIQYINNSWPKELPSNEITTPVFDDKDTQIKTVRIDGVVVAEICNEFLREISTLERQPVIYPNRAYKCIYSFSKKTEVCNYYPNKNWFKK